MSTNEEISKLKVLCVLIYSAVFLMLILLGISIYSNKRTVSNNSAPIIIGNNNSITINIVEPFEKYQSEILYVRKEDGDKDFTLYEAKELFYEIQTYSYKYNISLTDALTIVNVESNFDKDAYVKGTKATGLCQITQICLNEFNKVTGNNYTLGDMYNPSKNLDVGFWYFSRLIEHYNVGTIRNAYISYNIGPSEFNSNKNYYCNGLYPSRKKYNPIYRYDNLNTVWKNL